MAAAEYGREASSGSGKAGVAVALKNRIVAALENPLALLDARSPGGRRPGPLHLTKAAPAPHERVLSEVREHPVAASIPGADGPAITDNGPVVPGALPDVSDQGSNSPISSPFNAPFNLPGTFLAPGGGAGLTPGNPGDPSSPGTPGGSSSGITPGDPGNPSSTPPGDPGVPATPPGDPGPPSTGGSTPVITIAEPASWSLMLFGLLVLVKIRHRRQRCLAA